MKTKYLPYWLAIITLACAMMGGCTLCRNQAVLDAGRYQAQGYRAQVATYDLQLDGLLWGGGIWTHHAQAVVWKDGKMQWVGPLGLSEEPTFRVKRMVVFWDVDEYRLAINKTKEVTK
jgi:hypothetical protein